MTDKQQPDPLTWVNANREDAAVKRASHKSFAAACAKKSTYHTAGDFDGINHWGDFLELGLVLSHIKWQREMLEEASDEIAYLREERIRLESENAELWAKQNEFNES